MGSNSTQIVSEILTHIASDSGKYYSDYYAGIAKDPKERLFDQHLVPEKNHCWIYRQATSEDEARKAEKFLLEKGMKGGGGGGDEKTVYVYCYRITENTKQ